MLKTKFLHFRNNPVRVAAFCFNNLKRAQVLETDISSVVDKIMQEEMDVVSYRVLGYLLLGVTRIYFKKVEYALEDCHQVLIEINQNQVIVNTEDFPRMRTLRMSVTIPDRLELDSFDLDILDDDGGGHTAPPEEITLKEREVVCKTEGFALFSHEKFEEFDVGENTSSCDHHIEENVRLFELLSMMDIEVFPLNSPIDSPKRREISQSSIFSQTGPMNLDSVEVLQGVEKEVVDLSGQDKQIIEDRTVEDIVPCDDQTHEGSSGISQEECIDICMFSGGEKECVVSVEAFNDSHLVDHSSVADKINEELIQGPAKKHDNKGKLDSQEKVLLQDERLSVIPPKSKHLDVTPQSTFQGDSVGRLKRGATTPESMLVSTPAVRERPRFSTRRRVVIDKMIVLPYEDMRKGLVDTKDLVCDRRSACHALLKSGRALHTVHRESFISSLPNRFNNPSLPCCSSELQLLFSKKKMKISNSLQIVETSGNLDVLESPAVGTSLNPPQSSAFLEIKETPRMLDLSESQASVIPNYTATVSNAHPSFPHENIEIELSVERNEVPNLLDEENSCGTENSELLAGWSGRTRKVASCLHQCFLRASARQEKKEDPIKFSQVFGAQARKQSARLFYEVLVLKTTGYLDVEQNEAYGDIAISKLPKLDQTF